MENSETIDYVRIQDTNFSSILLIKGEPELTDPFNLLINVKLRML